MAETRPPIPSATRVTGRRFAAHLVDGMIYTVLFVVAILLVGALPDSTAGDVALGATLVLGLTLGQVAYYVLSQRRHGRTPGKRLVGIKVVDCHGGSHRRERW